MILEPLKGKKNLCCSKFS